MQNNRSENDVLKLGKVKGSNTVAMGKIKLIHELNGAYRETITVLRKELETKSMMIQAYRVTMLEMLNTLDNKTVARLNKLYLKNITELFKK